MMECIGRMDVCQVFFTFPVNAGCLSVGRAEIPLLTANSCHQLTLGDNSQ